MSSRVTPAEVKEILDTSLTDSAITAFIDAASVTVTDLLGENSAASDLSNAQLKEVERWLTAHLIASTRERQVAKENAGQAGVTYDGRTGLGLDSTLYGQQVKLLDTTGTLANLEKTVGLKAISMYAVPNFDEDDE